MVVLNMDFSQIKPSDGGMAQFPVSDSKGWLVEIFDTSDSETKTDKGDGRQLIVKMRGQEGAVQGLEGADYITVAHTGSQDAVRIGGERCSAIAHCVGHIKVGRTEEWHGRKLRIIVAKEKGEGDRTRIVGYRDVNGNKPWEMNQGGGAVNFQQGGNAGNFQQQGAGQNSFQQNGGNGSGAMQSGGGFQNGGGNGGFQQNGNGGGFQQQGNGVGNQGQEVQGSGQGGGFDNSGAGQGGGTFQPQNGGGPQFGQQQGGFQQGNQGGGFQQQQGGGPNWNGNGQR